MSQYTLGERLLLLRTNHKMTQAQVANKIRVTPQAYSQYERDVRRPDYETLGQLADYYNIDLAYLMTGHPQASSTPVFLVEEYDALPEEARAELNNYLQYFRHKYNLPL